MSFVNKKRFYLLIFVRPPSPVPVQTIGTVPMTFIRAPYVTKVEDGVEVLAALEDQIVGVRYKNQLAFAFHPELDEDTSIHQAFVNML